ncbi:heme ABC transporter ATP-binding protein [Gluconobacter kanchanaburiensis]|uniref:Hemin import ATP-binding protein HmuV n=1 Tax=Gluconobacter kanchanaburiensis NBRC 103587 TaxID=1307948 RepID=A0A511BAI5_9PROT|nr:heme ABC transporter ATP-binding protein [Gluconobacter kanchanaburiensis]MBF0862245.1 heme ABC transporter ATP-binding protein [Gluconobacter kanchanaburiensis]GBR70571.1 ferrichrome transporter ATP-binding protein [Gluconobacter kanchanaburiensis NBRC 103587]GEK97419.1 hemin import ATP-binding protein HmuV [Gluconobacter kanchanaburiensis NBRC 103587]
MTLDIDAVSCRIGGRLLLDDISLRVPSGSLVAIVGPNGAGKSTLLRVASGLIPADAGRVMLDGVCLNDMTPERLATRRAMLAQDSPLRTRFPVRDLVRTGLRGIPAKEAEMLIAEVLRRVGMAEFVQRDVLSLSGGERQRVHLARVLAQLEAGARSDTPGLLLLDEPISAQDLARQALVLDIARSHVRRGGACLVVLHDLNWAASRADTVIVLAGGRICATGPPRAVLTPDMLAQTFTVAAPRVHLHDTTGRPFVVPHDITSALAAETENKDITCISP